MTTVIRAYDSYTGKPLPGSVTVDGATVTAEPAGMEAALTRWLGPGKTRAGAATLLDGYNNGRVLFTSGPAPKPAEVSRFNPRELRIPHGAGGGRWTRGLSAGEAATASLPYHVKALPGAPVTGGARQVAVHLASGVRSEKEPAVKGMQGTTTIATFGDGAKAVHKTGMAPVEFDHEELAGLVADAIGGTHAPGVLRTGAKEMWLGFAAGSPAVTAKAKLHPEQVATDPHDHWDTDPLFAGDRGLRIGLLDLLTENQDRHWGNWMIDGDQPVPIDHSTTFGAKGGMPGRSPFMLSLTRMHPGHFTPAQLDQIGARLEALAPAFKARGHEDWLRIVLKNLADFREEAAQAPGAG